MLRQSGLGNMVSISLCRLQEAGSGSERGWQQTHESLSWGQGTPVRDLGMPRSALKSHRRVLPADPPPFISL